MRTLKKTVKQDLTCVVGSFDQVREFFKRTPCKSLDRMLFGITDSQGNTFVVSVAWVGFRARRDAHDLSRPTGNTIVIAEAEPAAGHISDDVLYAIAEVAVLLPRSWPPGGDCEPRLLEWRAHSW